MSVSKILEEMERLTRYANEDVETGAPETLNARRGRKRSAEVKLKELADSYTDELIRGAIFVLVAGANGKEFSDAVSSEAFQCFTADPEGLYKDIVDKVPSVLVNGRESTASVFGVISRHLEDQAIALRIRELPQIIFKQQYQRPINSRGELLEITKRIINEQVGAELAGVHAVRSIASAAIAKKHSGERTPLFMHSDDDQLTVDLAKSLTRITPNVFLVVAGKGPKYLKNLDGAILVKEVNNENVEKVLTTIKNSIRK